MVQPRCVWACDCDVPSVSEASEQAAAIFAGRVIDVAVPSGTYISSADTVTVTFAVATAWKGGVQSTVTLATLRSEISCGYEFQEGQEYLVYARPAGTTLLYARPANTTFEVSFCSRTHPLADATADLAALGEGQTPIANATQTPQPSMLPNTSGEIQSPALNLRMLVVLGALGVVAVVFAGHVVRK
jgi:hypothetical protein